MGKSAREGVVYALCEPGPDGAIRYIGKTINLNDRIIGHRCDRTRTHRGAWIRKLRKRGERFAIMILERCLEEVLSNRERHWIRFHRDAGARLTNATDGGEGAPGCVKSAATRAKLSAAGRGRRQSKEEIEKRAATLRGRRRSPEIRAKMGIAQTGRRHSVETKAKLSRASTGRLHTNEAKEKISAAHKGKPKSDETKAKLAASHRGMTASAEARARMSAAQKGRHHSPETKAKIAASRLGRKHTAASKEKMAAAQRGKKHTAEHRAKIGAASTGRRHSEATKARMSEIQRATKRARPEINLHGVDVKNSKVNDDIVREIRCACASGETRAVVAKRFGISDVQVGNIVRRKSWAHVD